mgnify:CR=1 FL=1
MMDFVRNLRGERLIVVDGDVAEARHLLYFRSRLCVDFVKKCLIERRCFVYS